MGEKPKSSCVLTFACVSTDSIKTIIPSVINKITGQIDILPTLCNLLGLDGSCLLGNDILGEDTDTAIIVRDGTVIGKDFIHYIKEDFVYDSNGNKLKPNKYYI